MLSRHLQQFALAFIFAFVFWLLLVGSIDRNEMVAGVLVAAASAVLTLGRAPILNGIRLTPTAPLSFLAYLGSLLVALLRANLDMARRVLSPALPIRPAMVRITTSLRSDLGRLVLANSITLTPGTLSVDIDVWGPAWVDWREDDGAIGWAPLGPDGYGSVGWIDCPPGTDIAAATQTIAGDFERHLRGFLA